MLSSEVGVVSGLCLCCERLGARGFFLFPSFLCDSLYSMGALRSRPMAVRTHLPGGLKKVYLIWAQ